MSGYVSNVPLTTQSLGQTQPTINNNFTVLNTDFGTDHVDFTNASPPAGNGGRHNQVSLVQQAGDPTAVSVTPIIYSEQVTYPGAITRTEEFIREASGDGGTVIALTNFFAPPVTGANGSSFIPGTPVGVSGSYTTGGTIVKWGIIQIPNAFNTVAVNFVALGIGNFPNNCYVAFATPVSAPAGLIPANYPGTTNRATTGFSINRNGTAGALFYQFYAIGN